MHAVSPVISFTPFRHTAKHLVAATAFLACLSIQSAAATPKAPVQNFLNQLLGQRELAPEQVGFMDFSPIRESSGLLASRRYPGIFWTHNDAGDIPRIFAVREDGSIVRPPDQRSYQGILVRRANHFDWESICYDDLGRLIIGDIGNNYNQRKNLAIYIIPEPDPFRDRTVTAVARVPFRYADQNKFPPEDLNFDAEALFWANGHLHLLTKHRSDDRTKLYRFGRLQHGQEQVLSPILEFKAGGMVTGADTSPDELRLAVLTYRGIWLFQRRDHDESFFDAKRAFHPISAGQCEGIAFHGHDLFISNEGRQLFRIPLQIIAEKLSYP